MMTTEKYPLIAKYKNGNYSVTFFADGTKIKQTANDEFAAEFPDSIDLKITNFCDMNCPMCHENSSEHGKHGGLNAPFLNTLHFGTELAIGGGNPLSHPDLHPFLERMKAQNIICNLTVNERHFLRHREYIEGLLSQKLIWGLGISINACESETILFAKQNKTVILHAICGIFDENTLQKLSDNDLKLLLLGYKNFGRGKAHYSDSVQEKIEWLKNSIMSVAKKFHTICFDNLALKQLEMRSKIPQDTFDGRYMGDDGTASMYIDLVNEEYAVSSTSERRFKIEDDIKAMFKTIQK